MNVCAVFVLLVQTIALAKNLTGYTAARCVELACTVSAEALNRWSKGVADPVTGEFTGKGAYSLSMMANELTDYVENSWKKGADKVKKPNWITLKEPC